MTADADSETLSERNKYNRNLTRYNCKLHCGHKRIFSIKPKIDDIIYCTDCEVGSVIVTIQRLKGDPG